jgi:oligo-alginate lyase
MMIDVSPRDSYVIDLFRVVGGQQHAKLIHGHFGHLAPSGLTLQATEETLGGQQMRSWRKDSQPELPWSVDWKIEDHLNYLPAGKQLHMRYTDLTPDTEVLTAEGWVAVGLYGGTADAWIPRVVVRRRAQDAPLASTFVGVIEPYEQQPLITHIRRLDLVTDDGQPSGDSDVALELRLSDGRRDVVLALDAQRPLGPARGAEVGVRQKEHQIRLAGQFGFARFDATGALQWLLLGNGTALRVGRMGVDTHEPTDWVEVDLTNAENPVISSSPAPAKYTLRTHD